MGWKTSESPLPHIEIHHCDKQGCRQLARIHFLSVNSESGERRVARRCDACAEELRAKVEKRAVAVAPKPKPGPPDPDAPHHCHARGCLVEVPPKLLMCAAHWRMVPKDLQAAVWREYRPGQEIDKQPTSAYLDVMEQAIAAVALKESKPKRPPKRYQIPEQHSVSTCTSCASGIVFIVTENGARMPVEPYGEHRGESHFIHCPNADEHRRPRAG